VDPDIAYEAPSSIPYLDTTAPYDVGKGSSSYFAISPTGVTANPKACDVTSCALYGPNCEKAFVSPHIKISDKAPFQITAATNIAAGYSVEFCVACWNPGYTKSVNTLGYPAATNTIIT